MTAFMPIGESTYHGLATQLTRRFANGLQLVTAYTWSHNIDDATAVVDSTVLSPRRPENSQDLMMERASSALDHRQRLTLEMLYDVPYFKNRSWFTKNVIGNWEIAPIYTYQTGTLWTPQSGVDSNLNGDSAPDRVDINPAGNIAVGTGASPLLNSAGEVVAYLANNPNARFVAAPPGTFPNGGRNLLHLNPINDLDLTVAKRFSFTERMHFELSARVFNLFNHPQYVGGYINDVAPLAFGAGTTSGDLARSAFIPGEVNFNQPSQVFSSNPRTLQLAAKFIF
jgi:hypothetical protein